MGTVHIFMLLPRGLLSFLQQGDEKGFHETITDMNVFACRFDQL